MKMYAYHHAPFFTHETGGGSAVSGMDGITLTDMGGGWVLLPCDQIGADAIWTKNGQKMDKNGQK